MNNKTKKTIFNITVGLFGFLAAHCLVLNNAGFAPTGSMTGAEFSRMLQGTGSTAFQFGVTNYCTTRADAVACVEALGGAVAGGMILAGVGLSSNVNYEQDVYYTSASINECERTARWEMILATQIALAQASGGDSAAGVGPGDLTAAALTAGSYGAARCELVPVGNLISAGDVNF